MGMTDSQFKGFIRFVLDALLDALSEKDNLQKVLED